MATGVRITQSKRAAARAMVELGASVRHVAKELGISKSSVAECVHDPYVNKANVEMVKARMSDRMIVSADRFLSQGLDGIKGLHPYQAVLCAGIMHDHYLRASAASRGDTGHGLTQILVLIDQRSRGSNE